MSVVWQGEWGHSYAIADRFEVFSARAEVAVGVELVGMTCGSMYCDGCKKLAALD